MLNERREDASDEEQEEADMFEYLPTARRLLATISTKLVCTSCGNAREKLEEFRDLSVDFPHQENHGRMLHEFFPHHRRWLTLFFGLVSQRIIQSKNYLRSISVAMNET